MYESRKHPLLPLRQFAWRVWKNLVYTLCGIGIALGIGIAGYHFIARLGWIDSLLNASMILGGMGPVDPLQTAAAKVFASAYALFSGLMFVALAGLLVAPFLHRMLHRFHIDEDAS